MHNYKSDKEIMSVLRKKATFQKALGNKGINWIHVLAYFNDIEEAK